MKAMIAAEPLSAMQHIFLPTSALEAMRKNACSFWETQDRLLDAMQTFSNGWFERRHAGTYAALEATQRMCKAETPIDAVREYQEWVGGALQRLMADGLACHQEFMAVIGSVPAPSVALSSEKQTEPRMTARASAA